MAEDVLTQRDVCGPKGGSAVKLESDCTSTRSDARTAVGVVGLQLQLQFGTCRVGNTLCLPTARALRVVEEPALNDCAEVGITGTV